MIKSCSVEGISCAGRAATGPPRRGPVQHARFLHHLRELFHEERHAPRSIVNLIDDGVRRDALQFLRHELGNLPPVEPIQGQRRMLRADRRPGGLKLGTEREQGQNPFVQSFGQELREKLLGRGVDPMQILDDEQNRPPSRRRAQPILQGPKHFFPLPHGRQAQRREAFVGGQRQQRRKQAGRFRDGRDRTVEGIEPTARTAQAGASARPNANACLKNSIAG